ncbi:MAG: uridylate kinase [Methylococcales bacterium]
MWVVKLGGSLSRSPQLKQWLKVLVNVGERIVIVPGGAAFADQVRDVQRHWRFNDVIAHQMAILAMNQYGLMFKGMVDDLIMATSIEEIQQLYKKRSVVVWLPSIAMLGQTDIPASWSVTSDSLAAWLAQHLPTKHLILVKSIAFDLPEVSTSWLVQQDIVDASFPHFINQAGFDVWILEAGNAGLFYTAVRNGANLGTHVLIENSGEDMPDSSL